MTKPVAPLKSSRCRSSDPIRSVSRSCIFWGSASRFVEYASCAVKPAIASRTAVREAGRMILST